MSMLKEREKTFKEESKIYLLLNKMRVQETEIQQLVTDLDD